MTAGIADAGRIAVTGRSYGGYLTLASLAFSPGVFAAGVDICGMSRPAHLLPRHRAVDRRGRGARSTAHPERDRALLEAISPLAARRRGSTSRCWSCTASSTPTCRSARRTRSSRRCGPLGRPVEYLELAGEGHEYRRAESRKRLVRAMVRFLAGVLGLSWRACMNACKRGRRGAELSAPLLRRSS